MNYIINSLSYLIVALLMIAAMIILTIGLIKGHKKYSRSLNLFLFSSIIGAVLYLISETIDEFNAFLWIKPTIDTLFFIIFILWFILLMKGGLPRAWKNKEIRTILIVCGVFMSISFIALLVFLHLK